MARLPEVGGDEGNWGEILNEFLLEGHKDDGTHKDIKTDSVTTDDLIATNPWVDARAFGSSKNHQTLQAALNDIGTKKTVLLLAPGNWTINQDLTIPKNVTLKFLYGAYVTLANNVNLILEGGISAENTQLFAGQGKVQFRKSSVPHLNIRWWGAQGDNETDDTAALQAAFDCAEDHYWAHFTNERELYQTLSVYVPQGSYVITGVTMTVPLRLHGEGIYESILSSTQDKPLITVRLDNKSTHNVASESSPYFPWIAYAKPRIERLCLTSHKGQKAGDNQHGVHVRKTIGFGDAKAILDNVKIYKCGGHGFLCDEQGNTNIIENCMIQNNSGAGIFLSGEFCTNFQIKKNIIRRNNIGIKIEPSVPDRWIATGFIRGNLIESNIAGVGKFGTEERPAIGMYLNRVAHTVISYNYFEGQINNVYGVGNIHFVTFEQNYHDGASRKVPAIAGIGTDRQVAPYYFLGNNDSNTIRGDIFYATKRVDGNTTFASETEWGTDRWGDEYEHLPVLGGHRWSLLNNYYMDNSGTVQDITYNASPASVHYQGMSRETNVPTIHSIRARKLKLQSYFFERHGTYFMTIADQENEPIFQRYYSHAQYPGSSKVRFELLEKDGEGNTIKGDNGKAISYEMMNFMRAGENRQGITFPSTGIMFRDSSGSISTDRLKKIQYGSGPSSEYAVKGDIIYNQSPTGGGYVGWVCVSTGNPGTWKPFGRIEN